MRKPNKIIHLFILIIMIMLNHSIIYGTNLYNVDKLEENANKLGYQKGIIKAYENNSKDISEPYYIAWPSDISEIIEEYKYAYDDFEEDYGNIIEIAYREGFKIGYNEVIKDSNKDSKEIKEEKLDYPITLGKILGNIYGYRDFYDDNKNNWNKALPSDKRITEMYNLNRETIQYKYDFLRTFKESFKEGYNEGYRKANFEPIKTSYEDGIKDGEYFGEILGTTSGLKDYFDNKSMNYERNILSDSNIQKEYSLNNDVQDYREGFLVGFKRSYEKNYNETFRAINLNEHKWSYKESYNHGKEVGIKKGKVNATKDYYLKLDNDWKRHHPTEEEIIKEYNLILETERFKEGFISGFKEGLSEGYITTFQNLNKEIIKNKIIVEEVPISGGEIVSPDNKMSLKIDKGIYYNPVIVTISSLSDNINDIEKGFIKASNYYGLNVANKSYTANNKDTLELKFEYYGEQNGGIYKFINDKWFYLPSEIEDGFIKAKVKPNSFKEEDNIYCVLVDKNALLLTDIRNHWAKHEINTFLRRRIISGYPDKTFKPDKNITRGDFLIILSKVYDWQTPQDITNIKAFKDYNGFKDYKEVISYAVNEGYINGYSDKTFRPHKPITYKEVEIIMKKITGTQKFYWPNISSKMLYEKDFRSKSYSNINNNITRAEVIYMLQVLNEWKY